MIKSRALQLIFTFLLSGLITFVGCIRQEDQIITDVYGSTDAVLPTSSPDNKVLIVWL